jgi:integrase
VSVAEFVTEQGRAPKRFSNDIHFSVEGASSPLRDEFQYALQCRHDERAARLAPHSFHTGLQILLAQKARSVRDQGDEHWATDAPDRGTGAWLRYVHRMVLLANRPSDLLQMPFWVAQDIRTVKAAKGLIRFDRIGQPWLADPVRRWALWRLQTGRAWTTVQLNVAAMQAFSSYISRLIPEPSSMADLSREVIFGFVGHLRAAGAADQTVSDHTSGLRRFLDEYRIRPEWGPALPASAVIRVNEVRAPMSRLPRPVAESVMRQIESPEHLSTLPTYLLALVLLGVRCGLRLASALRLPFDCMRFDSLGQPTLVYVNTKLDRERALPIVHPEVVSAIESQRAAVRLRFPHGCNHLFPRPSANPDGTRLLNSSSVNASLAEWLQRCGISDPATGQIAKVTYHQFRHTFATRLIENGASEYFVSLLLDHRSTATTRGYAQLSDQARREEFLRTTKVNNRGEVIEELAGPSAEVEWVKQGLNRLQMTLPNGYCGLPLQQACEVRNACLDCDQYFITTKEFLGVHRAQLEETRRLIAVAESNGRFRMVEKNQQLATKLEAIIDSLEDPKVRSRRQIGGEGS